MLEAARIGRQTANGPEARKKHAITARKNALAQHAWKPSDQPAWLTEKFYAEKVQPLLATMSASAIARKSQSRVGTLDASARATDHIHGTGRRWHSWLASYPMRADEVVRDFVRFVAPAFHRYQSQPPVSSGWGEGLAALIKSLQQMTSSHANCGPARVACINRRAPR